MADINPTCPAAGSPAVASPFDQVIQRRIDLLINFFFDRQDVVAVEDGRHPSPTRLSSVTQLASLLAGHVSAAAPLTEIQLKTTSRSIDGSEERQELATVRGRFRAGSYTPSPAGRTRRVCIDLDGGSHKHPLEDPLGVALRILARCLELKLPAYLEKSRSGTGWHVWIFFDEMLLAADARALGLFLAPKDAPLKEGGLAEPERGIGIEVFPKSLTLAEGGVGHLVYLPFFCGAPEGCNTFYRPTGDGGVEHFEPMSFELAPAERIKELVAEFAPPEADEVEPSAPGASKADGSSLGTLLRAACAADPCRVQRFFELHGVLNLRPNGVAGWLKGRAPGSPLGKDPAFGVNPRLGVWRDHRTEKHGGLVDFLVDYAGITRRAAAQEVTKGLGLVLPPSPPASSTASATLPTIRVPGDHADGIETGTHEFVWDVLDTLPEGLLYRWDSVVGQLVGGPGERRFIEAGEHHLRTLIDSNMRLALWRNTKAGTPHELFLPCSRDLSALVLAVAGTSGRVRELRALVQHPTYGPDLVLSQPGWNEASGLYFDPPDDLTNLHPTPIGAMDVLDDLLVDFPFADAASEQNFIGLMLTAIVRPAIAGPVPFHLVKASLERTGKGKLISMGLGAALLGNGVPVMQTGRSEEEREKRLTSLIVGGTPAVHFDNLPLGDILDSPSLASLATAWPRWMGRLLGSSRIVNLPNNLIVVLSGNNPKATGEIVKRTVPIDLQPQDPHPELRSVFVHPDAEKYARSRRRAVLEALTGMVEAWKAAGCPAAPHARSLGAFEEWARVVGGVLAHAGLVEWMANYAAWVRASDEVNADNEALVREWASRFGEGEVSAQVLCQLATEIGVFPAITSRKEDGRLVAFAKRVLSPLRDRPVLHWIVRREGSGSSSKYRLSPALVCRPKASASIPPGGVPQPPKSPNSNETEPTPASTTTPATQGDAVNENVEHAGQQPVAHTESAAPSATDTTCTSTGADASATLQLVGPGSGRSAECDADACGKWPACGVCEGRPATREDRLCDDCRSAGWIAYSR